MSTVGYATLQIIPAIKGISGNISQQIGGDLAQAGQRAGRDAGDAIAAGIEASKGKVAKASAAVAKARDAEITASEKVGVAEAKLQALRDKGVDDVGRLAAAEAAVSKAKRDHAAAAGKLGDATSAQTDAAAKLAEAEATAAERAAELADAANGAGDSVEDLGGKSLLSSENIAKIGIAAGAAAIAAGAALYKIGEEFDDVVDTIRVGTGATGAQLDEMAEIAKTVGTEVPASFGDIGTAIADLNTRLGLTGPELQEVTAQVMELSNMGEDIDINVVSGAMSAFGVEASQTSETLDELFRVSQATGVPVGKLAESATKGAPALKQFGFNAASSAGLIGSLDKAGLDADKMMAGLTKSLGVFAKEGKKPQQALYGSVVEIEKFTKAGNDAEAINVATKLFGTKGAAQFVDAVKQGKFSVDDFVSATGAGSDTIRGASEDTRDFAENWTLLKNRGMAALEPVASQLFGIIGEGMGFIADRAIPALQSMAGFIGDNKIAFGILGGVLTATVIPALTLFAIEQAKAAAASVVATLSKITGAWRVMGTALRASAVAQWAMNSAILANPLTWIVVALVAVGVALWAFFTKTEKGRELWDKIWNGIKAVVGAVVTWFTDTVWPAMKTAFQWIGDKVMWLWNNVMKPAWNGIKTLISVWWAGVKIYFNAVITVFKAIGTVVMWLWNNVFKPAWNGIKAAISVAWTVISAVIAGIKAGFQLIGKIAMWLWNNAILPAWRAIQAGIEVAGRVIGVVVGAITAVFQAVADKAGEVKDWIVERWNSIVDFFTGVKDKIASAASGMWDGIKDAFKSVINWVIRAWNSLQFTIPSVTIFGKKMGGGTIGVPKIPELATGGMVAGLGADGRLFGPGTGTSDSILGVGADGLPTAMVSAGEFVVNAKSTARWLPLLQALNGAAGGGRSNGMQALAAGGLVAGSSLSEWEGEGGLKPISVLVRRLIHQLWPEITDIGGYRASDPFPDHPSGQALDIMISDVGLGDSVKAWLMDNKDIFGLNYTIWQQQYEPASGGANMMEDRGSPTQNHMDHIHGLFGEIGSPPDVDPNVVPEGIKWPEGMEPAADADPAAPTDPASPDTGTADTTTDSTTPAETDKPKRMKSFRELGQDVGGLVADGIVDFFGIPGWIVNPEGALKVDDGSSVRTEGSTTGSTPNETPADPAAPDTSTTEPDESSPATTKEPDAKDYSGWITKAAKDLNLPEKAAVIGNATGLVEVGDPMKMYANNAVPESLNYPHDAVGSDHDSVGLFQQRDNGAWGTVAQRMDPYESAKMFFAAMVEVAGWETMPEGDVAQATQRSAFPDRYATMIPRAQELVKNSGLYDTGGWLKPGGIAFNQLKRPEPVLHPDHWDSIVDQTDAVGELVGAGVGGGGQNITIYGQTTGEIVQEFRREQWRGSHGYGSRSR